MTIVAFFDVAFLATLPGRTIEPAVMDRRGTVRSGPLTLCGRLSNPLIEVDAVVHEDCPDAVCDVGYGIAPGTVIDGGGLAYTRLPRGSRRSRKRGVRRA